ncbi:glycoside hydrolase family 15 protein [Teichococcus oryzae]|uniref:Glycoside hydrolase family 15 protein n=1 Tax=Teichococcus oryzae TaxID=1608942 RepID=A0A5B2TE24_9PROT|nr:glycoside hydrolase family 15 protein [Pseudoroseomonas oryzae]KAA2212756.1 glycoside hydrolase family 15 protein [Pseudoroseomonas oryzae]
MPRATRGRYRPISDYGIVGDTRSTALIAPDGSVDWLCWPRHDSPALFLRILDDLRGGLCTLEGGPGQGEPRPAGRRYLPGTNILETRLAMAGGEAVLTDFMPLHPVPFLPAEGPDGEAEGRLIRLLRCASGTVSGWFRIRPAFDYGRLQAGAQADAGGILFTAGGHRLHAAGSAPPEQRGNEAWIPFALRQGEEAFLVLTPGLAAGQPSAPAEGVAHRLARTRRYWEEWSARCRCHGPYREVVLRSALCLKLLCDASSGAMIAAATAGLPGVQGGGGDGRLACLRDASATASAFAELGYGREAAEFLRFLRAATGDSRPLPRYAIGGHGGAGEVLAHLEGHRGSGPVRIGEVHQDRWQHGTHGELLFLLHLQAGRAGRVPQGLGRRPEQWMRALAERALASRHEPDHGFWALDGPPLHHLHSRAMLWRALDTAARCARALGQDEAAVAGWNEVAAGVREEYHRRGWSIRRGAFAMAYGSDRLDAALLRAVLHGAFEPQDPRIAATLEVILRELAEGDLMRPHDADEGLPEREGAFVAASFWLAGCLALSGRTRAARALFERLLGRANDLGLYAEGFAFGTGDFLGNFPCAPVQAAVVNQALRLEAGIGRFGLRD